MGRHCPPINHLLFADDTMFFGKSNAASCSTLIAILAKYEAASGQCINRSKSAITFSSKTSLECKTRAKRELNIENEGGIGKYLGLPEHFGRKKRDIFASIVDRIKQRAQSWTARFLSGAGKMVLLKAVLASMPTYAMSCFKLPMSLCKQIQSVLTRFWWDIKPELRKMCWVSWEKLTLPKGAGGLGFREIEVFNDALLAKHTWKLLRNPSSLLGQTLLNKYCLHQDLLTCSAPNAASHGWRGILAGRDIINRGMGWSVGNGESIPIWRQNWLSINHQAGPMGPPTEEALNLKVKDLILPHAAEWDVDQIRLHLPHHEKEIRKLVLSSNDLQDERIWLYEKSGEYSAKTGYAVAKVNNGGGAVTFNWKQCVWNVKCSPKLKHFLWKLKNNALAVGEALLKRGMQVDGKCKRCGALETVFHVMFSGPFAVKVWDLAPATLVPSSSSCHSMEDLLKSCTRMVNLPPTGLSAPLYPWIFWVLWTSRNQFIFEDKSFSEAAMMLKAIVNAKEWQSATQKPKKSTASSKDCPPSSTQNQVNATTLYSDAAWNSSTCAGGLGWVIKDHLGSTLTQGSSPRSLVPSALVAEALALKEGLSKATLAGIKDIVCLSDSKCLVQLLTGNKSVTALRGILHDICVLSRSFTSISYRFISRVCNAQADELAKLALFLLSNGSVVN